MEEKFSKGVGGGGECGALLVGLSKEFDCLEHGLLLAKLNAHMGSITNLLNSLSSFLSNRKYRRKIN